MLKIQLIKEFIYQKILKPIFRPIFKYFKNKRAIQYATMNLLLQTTDATKIPRAQGPLRIYQQANAIFLKQLISIFEKYNISYWLMAGTLLGCVRHKGFIPWDADIDIAVISDDYEKLTKIFDEEFKQMPNHYYKQCDIIKVFYKDLPLTIDIEPFYVYPKYLDDKGRNELKKELKNCHKKLLTKVIEKDFESCMYIINKTENELQRLQEKILNVQPTEKKMIIGTFRVHPDFFHNGHMIFDYDWIYPLKKGEFEGITCNIPNNVDLNLMENYGKNYMYLPRILQTTHYNHAFKKITPLILSRLMNYIESFSKEGKD